MDQEKYGKVDLETFVNYYHVEQKRLHEEIEDTEYRIKDYETRIGQLDEKLEELRK